MFESQLTQRELLHFALYASKTQRADESIVYLKQLLNQDAANTDALFLLGSEYAELGLLDEAIETMKMALDSAPDSELIRFQLAMLFFSLNQVDSTRSLLTPLLEIEKTSPFKHFAQGISALINQELDIAIMQLNEGLSIPLNNPSLEENIRQLVISIEERKGEASSSRNALGTEAVQDPKAGEMFLSVYKN